MFNGTGPICYTCYTRIALSTKWYLNVRKYVYSYIRMVKHGVILVSQENINGLNIYGKNKLKS